MGDELMSLAEIESIEARFELMAPVNTDSYERLIKTARAAHEWKAVAQEHDRLLVVQDNIKEENEKLREALRKQASISIAGMNAARAASYEELREAYRLRKESSPEVIDSERSANAILTEENERLREELKQEQAKRHDLAKRYEQEQSLCHIALEQVNKLSDRLKEHP